MGAGSLGAKAFGAGLKHGGDFRSIGFDAGPAAQHAQGSNDPAIPSANGNGQLPDSMFKFFGSKDIASRPVAFHQI